MNEESARVRTITIADEEYPHQLATLRPRPRHLLVRGPKIPIARPLLTITGGTAPSYAARRVTYDIALTCAQAGICLVVSSNTGIDRHALYGAWEGRRESVVVFDSPLPRSGWRIPTAILVTPFVDESIDARVRKASGAALRGSWGEATLVIEASCHGSSLATAKAALDGGKEVFVHTVGLGGDSQSDGSRLLVVMGAPVVSSYAEVATLLGWERTLMV